MIGPAELEEFGARVELSGSTGESSSATILASGRHGLEFFQAFGPPHAEYTGGLFDFDRDFAERYDGQDEIGFAVLRADGERFAAIGDGLADIAINLRNRGNSVFESWEGGSAESGRQQFGTLLSAVDDLHGQFTRLADVLGDVVETVDRACYDKAAGVARLYATKIDGRTAHDVDFLVAVTPRLATGEVEDDELVRAARLSNLPMTPAMRRTPGFLAQLAVAVDRWLTETFVPAYDAKAATFDALCAAAEDTLSTAWGTLSEALHAVRADQFDAVLPAAPEPMKPAPTGSPDGTPDVGTTGAEPLDAGPETGAMEPSMVRSPTPSASPVAPPTSGSATGAAGQGFFGGVPFFPGAGAQGGGDEQRRSLGLPVGESAFDDIEVPEQDEPTALGAADDDRRYNEEAEATVDKKADDVGRDLFDLLGDELD